MNNHFNNPYNYYEYCNYELKEQFSLKIIDFFKNKYLNEVITVNIFNSFKEDQLILNCEIYINQVLNIEDSNYLSSLGNNISYSRKKYFEFINNGDYEKLYHYLCESHVDYSDMKNTLLYNRLEDKIGSKEQSQRLKYKL